MKPRTDNEPLVGGEGGEGLLEVVGAPLVVRVERVVPRRLLPRHGVRARQGGRRCLKRGDIESWWSDVSNLISRYDPSQITSGQNTGK